MIFNPTHPMKHLTRLIVASTFLVSAQLRAESRDSAPAPAAPTPAPAWHESGELAPHRERGQLRRLDRGPEEMETVTFLGVETAPVSKTLIAQLNLPNHAGLVVLHVVSDSPAAAALKENDILLKLDDQILVNQQQLAVLVRNHKPGDEVNLTYIRGGKEATASVKLAQHQSPKYSDEHYFNVPFPAPGAPMGMLNEDSDELIDAGHVDRTLRVIQASRDGGPVHIEFEHGDGAGLRAVRINPGNSNLVYSDDNGSLELIVKDGSKSLVAKNPKGEQEFAGPVTTPQERKALPADVRARLEKLESMQNVTFHTDGDFKGTTTKIIRAHADPIAYRRHEAGPSPMPAF